MKNKYIDLLRRRPGFRNLWLASLVSLMGDWFNTIASVMIVNRYTETDLAISWILIARTLPRFLIGPFAGVLADRVNRKVIMVVSDILRAGIVLSFLLVDRPERAWLIYMLTVAQFIVASFFEPASSAILPGVVKGKDELVTANVLSSITWSTMLAVGAALGGVFAGLFGAQSALIADSATFLISAFFLFHVRMDEDKIPEASDQGGFRDLIDGLRYILRNIQVAVFTLVKSFGQIGSADIFIAVFAESYFPIGEGGAISMGILFGSAGLGALIGPLIGDWLMPRTSLTLRKAIQSGYLLVPLGWLLISWSPTIWVAALGILVRLIGTSINWTYSTVLIQMEVPDRYLGRVFSVDLGLFTLATSTAIFLTGYFLDNLKVSARQLGGYFAIGSLLPAVLWALYNFRKPESVPAD